MQFSQARSVWASKSACWEWVAAAFFVAAVAVLALATVLRRPPELPSMPLEQAVDNLTACVAANPGNIQTACTAAARMLSQRLHAVRITDLPVTPRVARFNTFVVGNTLAYRRAQCRPEDIPAVVTANIYARDPATLPADRREVGFVSEDFKFADRGVRVDGACVAVKTLPHWPVSRVVTGEFGRGQGFIWSSVIDF